MAKEGCRRIYNCVRRTQATVRPGGRRVDRHSRGPVQHWRGAAWRCVASATFYYQERCVQSEKRATDCHAPREIHSKKRVT